MQYQIEIREIEPVRVAYMKHRRIAAEANKVFSNEIQFLIREGVTHVCY